MESAVRVFHFGSGEHLYTNWNIFSVMVQNQTDSVLHITWSECDTLGLVVITP